MLNIAENQDLEGLLNICISTYMYQWAYIKKKKRKEHGALLTMDFILYIFDEFFF
jgi:hypothetical protein